MAFGRAKEKTRVTLHLGGRDLDVWVDGDWSKALTTVQMGVTRQEILTLMSPGTPTMVIHWGAVPAFTVGETVPVG